MWRAGGGWSCRGGRVKSTDPALMCSPPRVITASSIGIKDTLCDPSPMCWPPGDIFGAVVLFGDSGETMPNLFFSTLGSIGDMQGDGEGLKSGVVLLNLP